MGAVEIIKLIAEIGFPIVCSGIFLYLAVSTFRKNQEWLESYMKKGSHGDHPSSEDSVALDAINSRIYQEIRGLLNALEADRTYVFLYHNGGASTSGLYFQKMSCICEVVSQGILPVASEYQGLHRGSYSLLCDELRSKEEVLIPDTSKLNGVDDFLHHVLVSRRALASYYRVLKDVNNHPIGFVGVDYCSLTSDIPDSKISELLKTVSLKVSSLVDIRDEVK